MLIIKRYLKLSLSLKESLEFSRFLLLILENESLLSLAFFSLLSILHITPRISYCGSGEAITFYLITNLPIPCSFSALCV